MIPDRALDTRELDYILSRHLPCIYRGVYSSDLLPVVTNFKLPWGIMVNTDCSHGPGIHWQCWYKSTDGIIHHFDSYGLPTKKLKLLHFLQTNSKGGHWTMQRRKIQGEFSHYCAHYCIYFMLVRSKTPLNVSDYNLMLDVNDSNIMEKLNRLLCKRMF